MHGDATPDETAAFWFAKMRSDVVPRRDLARFNAWLDSDPANQRAYEGHKEFWDSLESIAGDDKVIELRREALATGQERRGRGWHLVALAASIAIVALCGLFLFRFDATPVAGSNAVTANAEDATIYRTNVGQRATVTLADGSVVELNTDSLVEVRYAGDRRDIRLLRGQALFRVAKDEARPFVVEAADQRITALGTEFDVRFRRGEVRVTLVEGRVTVEREAPQHAAVQMTELAPGQQLVARADQPATVAQTNVQQAVSWSTGRLIFNDEPLGEVIEEINRYSTRKILLEDPSLANLKVSGVFQAGSMHGFVTALDAGFPVASRADEERNAYVLSWD